jgi:hypothetical protein
VLQHFSASHRSRIAPLSILGLLRPSRIAPFPAFPALCWSRICPCGSIGPCGPIDPLGLLRADRSVLSTFRLGVRAGLLHARLRAPRTGRELLRARHLAFRIAPGLLRSRCFPPCAACGSLRTHRLALAPGTNCFVLDTWPSAPCPGLSLRIGPCSLLPALRLPQIAPRSTLNTNCLARTSPRSTFSARTAPELPLAVRSVHGTRLVPASRGLLRVLPGFPRIAPRSTWDSPGVSHRIAPSLTHECFLPGPVVSL